MVASRLARLLRRGPRSNTADDDEWWTAPTPLPDMDVTPPEREPAPPAELAAAEADAGAPKEKKVAVVLDRLKSQELELYTLTFSPRLVITLYFLIGIVFLPLGATIIAGTGKIRGTGPHRYSDEEKCDVGKFNQSNVVTPMGLNGPQTCNIQFNITERVPAPSYLYYSISNFHQNHRTYAPSRSDTMNMGLLPKVPFDVENCRPWLYPPDTPRPSGFDASAFIYPCGLAARSRFTDKFDVCKGIEQSDTCAEPVKMTKNGIAWWTDREVKFQPGQAPEFQEANKLLEDEDFMVWMRLSAFPDFDKLYRIIQEPLEPGDYTVIIRNNYPVNGFAASKSFYISTTQWFGGPNGFLGASYIVVGFIALFIATTLLVKHILHPRPPASSDPTMLMRELAKLNAEYRTARPDQ